MHFMILSAMSKSMSLIALDMLLILKSISFFVVLFLQHWVAWSSIHFHLNGHQRLHICRLHHKYTWVYIYIYIYVYIYMYVYRQVSIIRHTLLGNKIVDHSDLVGESPVARCSNYIFILELTPGFIELDKDNSKTRRETLKFGDLAFLILEIYDIYI